MVNPGVVSLIGKVDSGVGFLNRRLPRPVHLIHRDPRQGPSRRHL